MSSGTPLPQAANAGDARRPLSRSASCRAVLGREERVDVEDAQLAQRRRLDLADQRRQVEVAAQRARRSRSGWRAARTRGSRAGRPRSRSSAEQAHHRALDLVPQRLGLGLPRQRRRLRASRRRSAALPPPSRACRSSTSAASRSARIRSAPMPCDSSPAFQSAAVLAASSSTRHARGAGVVLAHPRAEVGRRELGEREQQVAHVALRVEDQRRHACEQRLLQQHDPEARLAGARHADDDAVGGQVLGFDGKRLARRSHDGSEEEVGHAGESSSSPSSRAAFAAAAICFATWFASRARPWIIADDTE